ncbi:MAG: alpha/beta fold hydrolase [Pseudomonadota bacterium]
MHLRTLCSAIALLSTTLVNPTNVAATTETAAAVSDHSAVGIRYLSASDPNGRRDLEGWIWYPTDDTQDERPVLGTAVWAPVKGIENATPARGRFPLVLVSHGMYGNTRNQAWLARGLAQRGYLVAAINHPGSTTYDRRPSESRRLWERPRDLSRLLDHLLADDLWRARVDPERVAAAGHSLGGLTVVRLVGAVGDTERHSELCARDANHIDCQALAQLNIGHAEDAEQLNGSDRDPRIRAAVSMDLGGTQSLSHASIAAIEVPMLVMGASRGELINQNRESKALAALLPTDLVDEFHLADTGHFDYLGECTDKGLLILREEEPEDAFICENGTDQRRSKHAVFVETIDAFLTSRLAQ